MAVSKGMPIAISSDIKVLNSNVEYFVTHVFSVGAADEF